MVAGLVLDVSGGFDIEFLVFVLVVAVITHSNDPVVNAKFIFTSFNIICPYLGILI